jgi:cytidine deaminase
MLTAVMTECVSQVGAAALSSDGRVFLGVNVEFARQPLDTAIHAEQFAMSNAAMNGAPGVTHLAATASPCGHCRQFCMELGAPNALRVIVDNTSTPPSLDELLPFGFGPAALGVLDGHFLKHKHFDASAFDVVGVATTRVTIPATASTATVFRAASADLSRELAATATAALARSYAPYTGAVCGCAIWFEDATTVDVERLKPTIAVGCYIESCAYNPSLSALRSALADMITRQAHWRDVRAIAIAELDGAKVPHVHVSLVVCSTFSSTRYRMSSKRKPWSPRSHTATCS